MNDEPKKAFYIRLPISKVEFINKTVDGESETERVTNYLISNIFEKEFYDLEIKKLELKKQHLLERMKSNVLSDTYRPMRGEPEFWNETIMLMKQNPNVFIGRFKAYNHLFRKRVTIEDFELLLSKKEEEYGHKREATKTI